MCVRRERLTCQTLARTGPGSGLCPHTDKLRGCLHRSVCPYIGLHPSHTHLCLGGKDNKGQTDRQTDMRFV